MIGRKKEVGHIGCFHARDAKIIFYSSKMSSIKKEHKSNAFNT